MSDTLLSEKAKLVQLLSSKIWRKSPKKEKVQNICTAPRPVCTTAIGHSPRQTCASRRCFLNRQKCSETQKSLPAPPKQQAFTNCNYSNFSIHNKKGDSVILKLCYTCTIVALLFSGQRLELEAEFDNKSFKKREN